MSTEPATIDLGFYSHRRDPEEVPEAPWLTRVPLVRLRQWAVVALLAVLAWPLAGAATQPTPQLALLWTVPGGPVPSWGVAVGDEDLYVITGTAGTTDGAMLTAYRLADGTIRWEAPLEVPLPGAVSLQTMAGVPVVYTLRPVAVTAVYDPETAKLRWTGEGYPEPLADGLVALYTDPAEPSGLHTNPDAPLEGNLEIRELTSGVPVTSVEGDGRAFGYQEAADGPPHLVGLGRDGVLASYDVTTGQVLRSRSTPHVEPLEVNRRTFVSVLGDMVLVAEQVGATSELVAYDATMLDLQWSIEDAQPAGRCGPLVCVHVGDTNVGAAGAPGELHGVDPVTGTSRWSVSCADGGMSDRCFMTAREAGSPGRLLVRAWAIDQRPGEPSSRRLLVNAGTGQLLAEPTEWDVWPQDGGEVLLSLAEGRPPRVWWARSDSELARIEVLGAVEAESCTPQIPYLVCYTEGEPVDVWRVGS